MKSANTIVTRTAAPADGWAFLHRTGDSTATTNVTTVLMDRTAHGASGVRRFLDRLSDLPHRRVSLVT